MCAVGLTARNRIRLLCANQDSTRRTRPSEPSQRLPRRRPCEPKAFLTLGFPGRYTPPSPQTLQVKIQIGLTLWLRRGGWPGANRCRPAAGTCLLYFTESGVISEIVTISERNRFHRDVGGKSAKSTVNKLWNEQWPCYNGTDNWARGPRMRKCDCNRHL